jgi:hypothetical protein
VRFGKGEVMNVGTTDRIIRVVLGLILLSLVFVGPQTWWDFAAGGTMSNSEGPAPIAGIGRHIRIIGIYFVERCLREGLVGGEGFAGTQA